MGLKKLIFKSLEKDVLSISIEASAALPLGPFGPEEEQM